MLKKYFIHFYFTYVFKRTNHGDKYYIYVSTGIVECLALIQKSNRNRGVFGVTSC